MLFSVYHRGLLGKIQTTNTLAKIIKNGEALRAPPF